MLYKKIIGENELVIIVIIVIKFLDIIMVILLIKEIELSVSFRYRGGEFVEGVFYLYSGLSIVGREIVVSVLLMFFS